MDLNVIRKLVKLVETSDIEELDIQEEGFQVRIIRGKAPVASQPIVVAPPSALPPQHPVSAANFEKTVQEAKIEPLHGGISDNVLEICSPMVGTFYRAPAPDAQPYITVGDTIQPGKILCIVEAMKLMNEIEAEISGRIVKVLVENAQPVEYNQPLFLVEKS
jgi:acetyl-CoA carboxylase biotin carboxyl carrier protein